eukprot:TRINITY_DN1200_c0_g1_i2.p2 TRINITY_DN1200_c0_g1~~TRINITY_DN1200_c0_g1_i2.p2  ORF type:complete len:215 (+),score=60.59 TRINITY_DN1200_c0_g1_i2:64-708(+)
MGDDGLTPAAAAAALADSLDGDGMCGFVDRFLGDDLAEAVLSQCRALELQPGEVSAEAGYWATEHKPDRRGDMVHWLQLEGEPEGSPLGALGAKLRAVAAEMVQLLPRLQKTEKDRGRRIKGERAMVAHYPGEGRRFVTHIDNPNKNGRVLSFCYYMNQGYSPEHGGALRVHQQINGGGVVAEIHPFFDCGRGAGGGAGCAGCLACGPRPPRTR